MNIKILLLQFFLNLLILGSICGLIVGAILILRPNWLEHASQFSNRWISTRPLDRKLEIYINIDSWLYRYRRAGGALILAGALYILYFFIVKLDKASTIIGMSNLYSLPQVVVDVLFDPIVIIAVLGATFALFISLFVLFRPSLLREFEGFANQWVSLRRAMKPLEIFRSGMDEFTFCYARTIGVLLVFGSLYTMVMLIFWRM